MSKKLTIVTVDYVVACVADTFSEALTFYKNFTGSGKIQLHVLDRPEREKRIKAGVIAEPEIETPTKKRR
jgi:hypothetical protein